MGGRPAIVLQDKYEIDDFYSFSKLNKLINLKKKTIAAPRTNQAMKL